MALSADQLYLLNSLTYLSKAGVIDAKAGMSIGDFARTIANSPSLQKAISDKYWTVEEIQSVCNQVVRDDSLSSMRIAHASRTEGGADCFVVTTPDGSAESQAIVVMEGTMGSNEWRDNFEGGTRTSAEDGVSTTEQEKCLDWFQSDEINNILEGYDKITVTGHSKGGNKAKHLTLHDDRIDECVSFDGQGFSDDYIHTHSDKIRKNQDKITNYSNKNDFVNILLNDVGESYYVDGSDEPLKNYDRNHSLSTLHDSLPLSDHAAQQSPAMKALDEILNGFLRQCSQREKDLFLRLLGEATGDLLGGDDPLGFDDGLDYYNMLKMQGGWELLKEFFSYAATYAGYEMWEDILNKLKEIFPGSAGLIDEIMPAIEGKILLPSGQDISVGADKIVMNTAKLETVTRDLRRLMNGLDNCAADIGACAEMCDDFNLRVKFSLTISLIFSGASGLFDGTPGAILRDLRRDVREISKEVGDLAARVKNAADKFESNEKNIIGRIPEIPQHAQQWLNT